MKITVLVIGLLVALGSVSHAQKKMSCGQMMATRAAQPKKLAELMTIAVEGTEAHAKVLLAVKGDAKAQAEAKALGKVAKGYKALGAAAAKLAADMEAMKDLESSPEAEKTGDMAKMMEMMTKQIVIMKELGKLMTDDAKKGEQMMKAAKAAAKKAKK